MGDKCVRRYQISRPRDQQLGWPFSTPIRTWAYPKRDIIPPNVYRWQAIFLVIHDQIWWYLVSDKPKSSFAAFVVPGTAYPLRHSGASEHMMCWRIHHRDVHGWFLWFSYLYLYILMWPYVFHIYIYNIIRKYQKELLYIHIHVSVSILIFCILYICTILSNQLY